ncbi:MAG: hypothetical protein QOH93_1190 [Chloroflexia bacterium]|jgi:hypothetical protein|nr:hypothetical protein [Chloroflexia bacterium]
MRVRRLLLFILVAVNLTIVCQGHADGSGHTGVHLALLGEPHMEDELVDRSAASTGAEAEHETRPTNVPVQEAGRNSDPTLLSEGSHVTSLSILAVALLIIFAGPLKTFSLYTLSGVTWGSRSTKPPEPPPPRLAHVTA